MSDSDFFEERRDSRYDSLLEEMPELLSKYWYVREGEEGLVFDFSRSPDYKEVKPNHLALQFFDQMFEKEYYIKGFFRNHKLIGMVFDHRLPLDSPILIGDEMLPVRTKYLEYYTSPKTSSNGQEASYEFIRMKMDKNKVSKTLDPDILMAHLWKNQVRYGFDYKEILKGIKYNRQEISLDSPSLVIARYRPPTPPVNASREDTSDKLHTDTRADIAEDDPEAEVDMYRFKNTIYHINTGEILYQKHPAKKGKSGRDIFGNSIPAQDPVDNVDLKALAGEGTEIKEVDGLESLISSRDGTLNVEPSGKVTVDMGIVVKSVDGSTGNLTLNMPDQEMLIQEDIEDARKVTLNLKKLTVMGRVYGTLELHGETEVILEGGMTKATLIHKGTGQILVKNSCLTSRVDAPKCQVAVEMAEKTAIVARMAKVKNLFHSTIIARMIKIMEMQNTKAGRGYVIGEVVEIKSIDGGGEAGITCVWRQDKPVKKPNTPSLEELKQQELGIMESLQKFKDEHQKLIQLYSNIDKLLAKPDISAQQKQQLMLQKRKVFTKVIQPLRDMQQKRDAITSQVAALKAESGPAAKKKKVDYHIRIMESNFDGDIFINAYEMDHDMKSMMQLGEEKLGAIARTSVIPAGAAGEKFTRIPAGIPLIWNHEKHIAALEAAMAGQNQTEQ